MRHNSVMPTHCYKCKERIPYSFRAQGRTLCPSCYYQTKSFWRRWTKRPATCEVCGRGTGGGRYCYYCGKRKGLW